MKASKRIILLAAFVVLSLAAHAQQFDWVKSYTGTDRPSMTDNYIVDQVSDNDGNLYILGQCSPNALFDGQTLVPIHHDNRNCIMIAKISTIGELLWHKSIASKGVNGAHKIKMMTDNSIMCMVSFDMRDSLYYLDTLLVNADNVLMPTDSMDTRGVSAFINLDFDGNLLSQDFLSQVLIDNKGNMLTSALVYSSGIDKYLAENVMSTSFDIDEAGNIYLFKVCGDIVYGHCDTCASGFIDYSFENGMLSGVKLLLNGQSAFTINADHIKNWNLLLMKFSPHFNELQNYKYVFENETGSCYPLRTYIQEEAGDIYLYGCMRANDDETASATVTGNRNLHFSRNKTEEGFLIKYSTDFNPIFLTQINMQSDTAMNQFNTSNINSIAFDSESVFLLSTIGGDGISNYNVSVNGTTIDVMNPNTILNTAFFTRLNKNNGSLLSYGKIISAGGSSAEAPVLNMKNNIVVNNNRVFFQILYNGVTDNSSNDSNLAGMGVAIFDYEGHPIKLVEYYGTSNVEKTPTYLCFYDSILYLTGYSKGDLRLGNSNISSTGNSTAYLAKYTDTAFMTPYVYTGDTGNVNITLVEGGNAFVAYPNPFRQRVTIESSETLTATAWLTDLTGRREQVRLTADGNGRYTLDLTARPQATYLLSLTTASGKTHTVRLMKMSDIFTR